MKQVRYEASERVDLPDITAMSALIDDYIAASREFVFGSFGDTFVAGGCSRAVTLTWGDLPAGMALQTLTINFNGGVFVDKNSEVVVTPAALVVDISGLIGFALPWFVYAKRDVDLATDTADRVKIVDGSEDKVPISTRLSPTLATSVTNDDDFDPEDGWAKVVRIDTLDGDGVPDDYTTNGVFSLQAQGDMPLDNAAHGRSVGGFLQRLAKIVHQLRFGALPDTEWDAATADRTIYVLSANQITAEERLTATEAKTATNETDIAALDRNEQMLQEMFVLAAGELDYDDGDYSWVDKSSNVSSFTKTGDYVSIKILDAEGLDNDPIWADKPVYKIISVNANYIRDTILSDETGSVAIDMRDRNTASFGVENFRLYPFNHNGAAQHHSMSFVVIGRAAAA